MVRQTPQAVSASGRDGKPPLCPGMVEFIARSAVAYAGTTGTEPLAEQRDRYTDFSRSFRQPWPEGMVVTDLALATATGAVPVRVYRPAALAAARLAPAVLYLHGGGWVLGSVDSHDCLTAGIAEQTGAIVVSVDYRLAPEHPFPAAFEDCRAVLRVLAGSAAAQHGIDPQRIVVAGDSAGANLAAALALAARDEGGPELAGQALIYPVLGTAQDLPSYVENANGPLLKTVEMARYWRLYLGGGLQTSAAYAAPLTAASFNRLPPALIWTAGHDPVRDDGTEYAARLRAAGVAVNLRCAPDLVHGYLKARHISASAGTEFAALCDALRTLLQSRC